MSETIRTGCRSLARLLLRCVQRQCRDQDLTRRTIVFAPHADDETLGCGGTILRKRNLGAEVHIVFLTDSARSHPHLASGEQMRARRFQESLAAAEALGVPPDAVHHLHLPDGQLARNRESAASLVETLLKQIQPRDIYVPYRWDGPSDHQVVPVIVHDALLASGSTPIVWEYPIWFWHHWPWTRQPGRWRALPHVWKEAAVPGFRLLHDFRWYVSIRDLLGQKRAALLEHRSQMERLLSDPSWLTLSDIAGGCFLECFFQEREIFCRHKSGEAFIRHAGVEGRDCR